MFVSTNVIKYKNECHKGVYEDICQKNTKGDSKEYKERL